MYYCTLLDRNGFETILLFAIFNKLNPGARQCVRNTQTFLGYEIIQHKDKASTWRCECMDYVDYDILQLHDIQDILLPPSKYTNICLDRCCPRTMEQHPK